jgi:hypothetical protein
LKREVIFSLKLFVNGNSETSFYCNDPIEDGIHDPLENFPIEGGVDYGKARTTLNVTSDG